MEHKGTIELVTDRLILRRFDFGDATPMFENWASDPEVTRYLTWPAHTDISLTQSIIEYWSSQYDNNGFYQWAIELKSLRQPIGSISVVRINDVVDECEVGYCIGRKWWRHGITSEALSKVIEFLSDTVKVKRISAKHDVDNPNSGRVMLKCGMQYEGTLRKAGKNSLGEICDLVCYAKLNY